MKYRVARKVALSGRWLRGSTYERAIRRLYRRAIRAAWGTFRLVNRHVDAWRKQ